MKTPATEKERLAAFGYNVLMILQSDQDWSSDTTSAIDSEAEELGLSDADEDGNFQCLAKDPSTPEEPEPSDLVSLAKLFPSLARLAESLKGLPGFKGEQLDNVAVFLDAAAQLGRGTYLAAEFIASVALSPMRFPIQRALSVWDSEHRRAFAEACRRLAVCI